MNKVLIIGSGFSGLTIARKLAEKNVKVKIIDERHHIGGNCYDERDEKTGINVHIYGPHIFHTDNELVWNFVNEFGKFEPYTTRIKANAKGRVYSLPVNLHTINQYYNSALSPTEAKELIKSKGDQSIIEPKSFEEQAIKFVGKDLYKTFFYGYPKKQWGMDPKEIPASVLKRLPVRFNYDDNYFFHKYQGIPRDGYTSIFENMLNHPNIELELGSRISRADIDQIILNENYDHVFFSGAIDNFYDYEYGRLEYRSLKFEKFYSEEDDYQGCVVMSYCDEDIPFTRITEHKYFTPWETHSGSVMYKEYSKECSGDDIPYYPVRHVSGNKVWNQYESKSNKEEKITFIGRLATYRYLDMDVCIKEALECVAKYIKDNVE
ncbi:Probable UDP-galactopyranose mutase [Yersinia frederiksenii]|uniref:UDP-galactopyranose mutase n=1 Tax=Yersinia frederiksenii TaxID=29484 RepID=UPI0005DF5753|nr:UDP-galactopyranose mutase [Yersinia frederiksenii]CNC72765.1 Probable UDP-galactopyranose mutase [Yersinia frederiksenii]